MHSLIFGILYPAYSSYKTVRARNVRKYLRWMSYWVVYAAYTFVEIFTDIFLAFWFPFYYELKILFVLWLVCPATVGSSFIFSKVIAPYLNKYENIIDSYVEAFWDHGYDLLRRLGALGMDAVSDIFLEMMRRGQVTIERHYYHRDDAQQPGSSREDEESENATDNSEAIEVSYASSVKSDEFIVIDKSESEPEVSEENTKMKTRNKKKVTTVRERKKNKK